MAGAWRETAEDFVSRNSTKSPVGKESKNNKTLPYFDAGLILNITLGCSTGLRGTPSTRLQVYCVPFMVFYYPLPATCHKQVMSGQVSTSI